MAQPTRLIFPTPNDLAQAAAQSFLAIAQDAIATRGTCMVALAGGSSPRLIYRTIAATPDIPWHQIHLFWGDERCVPPAHPDSNFAMAKAALLDRINIPESNVHRIAGELGPDRASRDYAELLEELGNPPVFDLIHLGLGSDGHTASLFLGDAGLESISPVVIGFPVTGMLPQLARVSLGLNTINAARNVQFFVTGENKTETVQAVFEHDSVLPAARVKAINTVWMLDKAAAGNLDESEILPNAQIQSQ